MSETWWEGQDWRRLDMPLPGLRTAVLYVPKGLTPQDLAFVREYLALLEAVVQEDHRAPALVAADAEREDER